MFSKCYVTLLCLRLEKNYFLCKTWHFKGGRKDIFLLPYSAFTQKSMVITVIGRYLSSHQTVFIIETFHLAFKQGDNLYASQLSLVRNVEWQLKVEALKKAYLVSTSPPINGNNRTDHFPCLAFQRRWWLFNRGKEVTWSLLFILGGLCLLSQQATKYLLTSFGVQTRALNLKSEHWSLNLGLLLHSSMTLLKNTLSIVSSLLLVEQ